MVMMEAMTASGSAAVHRAMGLLVIGDMRCVGATLVPVPPLFRATLFRGDLTPDLTSGLQENKIE